MTARRTRPGAGAFTLVEVLVALGIFALAAVVLGTAYVNVLLNYHLMRRGAETRSELAVVRARILAEPDLRRARSGGEMRLQEGGRLRWDVDVAETAVADLFRVTLTSEIAPAAGAGSHRSEQEFLLLRPTWSEPEKRERLRAAAKERLTRSRS